MSERPKLDGAQFWLLCRICADDANGRKSFVRHDSREDVAPLLRANVLILGNRNGPYVRIKPTARGRAWAKAWRAEQAEELARAWACGVPS